MNTVKCSSAISVRRYILCLILIQFVLAACSSIDKKDPLYGIDKTQTLNDLSDKRILYVLDCMDINPETLEPTKSNKPITKKHAQNCKKEAESLFPFPAPIEYEELISYCKQKHDIPTKYDDPMFGLTSPQEKTLNTCMNEVQDYRPVTVDGRTY